MDYLNPKGRSKFKIFKDLTNLQFKDQQMEEDYQNNVNKSSLRMNTLFAQLLLILGIFTCTLEGVLYSFNYQNMNLKWNFLFCVINLVFTLSILLSSALECFSQNRRDNLVRWNFLIHFCFENLFLTLTSVLYVFLNCGMEWVTFIFFVRTLTMSTMSLTLHKSFSQTLKINLIYFIFQCSLLLSIHVIKVIVYYILLHLTFSVITLLYIYSYESMTRMFCHSVFKLIREKESYIESMDVFNISYFSGKNNKIKKMVKMNDLILNAQSDDENEVIPHSDFNSIEDILKNLIAKENPTLPSSINNLLDHTIKSNKFDFKNLFKDIIKIGNRDLFSKFTPLGIVRLTKGSSKEEIYYRFFLKLKIRDTTEKSMNEDDISVISPKGVKQVSKIEIKFEGLFVDVTQNYIKKQIQVDSLVLAKSIHDIKSPLILLEEITESFRQKMKNEKSNAVYDGNHEVLSLPEKHFAHINFQTTNEEYSEYIKIVSSNIFQMIETINIFSKRQNNIEKEIILTKTNVDIRELISEPINYYKLYLRFDPIKCHIKLYSQVEPTIPKYVDADPNALRQVLRNLLSNAVKFTYSGEIKIICKLKTKIENLEENKFIEFNVIDTGIGIDEENLNLIGKPFGVTTSGDFKGSGLGLSIVNDRLDKLGSKLSFYSVKNVGSTFCFELALNQEYSSKSGSGNLFEEIKIKNLNFPSDEINMIIIPNSIEDQNNFAPNKEYKSQCSKNSEHSEPKSLEIVNKNNPSESDNSSIIEYEGIIIYSDQNSPVVNIRKPNSFKKNYYKKYTNETVVTKTSSTNLLSKFKSSKTKTITYPFVGKVYKVLIIDDDPIYLSHTSQQFKNEAIKLKINIETIIAYDAIEALCHIYNGLKTKTHLFNLIITDENMPFIKGSSFAKLYYEYLLNNGFYKVPIVSVISEADKISPINIKLFDSFLNKPTRNKDVSSLLNTYFLAGKQ